MTRSDPSVIQRAALREQSAGSSGGYRFAAYEVDLRRRELRRHGTPVRMQGRVFDLLVYLIDHADRVAGKEELINAVWSGSVVTDGVLTSAMRKLRSALQDDPRQPALIKTVHGRGYRFIGQLEPADASRADVTGSTNSVAASAARPGIVVLPFDNLTTRADQQMFADAVATDITTLLARHRWLRVIARHAAVTATAADSDHRALARALGADYIVEGTVRSAHDRIRVTAELIDGISGRHLWGERYDRDLADVFAVQDDITRMVVGRVEPEIGLAERHKVARAAHPDLHAWECYHLALAHFYRFTRDDNAEARRLFQRSRELDPQFGEAHAWWAYATVLSMVYWDEEPAPGRLDEALEAAQQALRIDDQNAVFYALKARVQLARQEYASAIHENQIAIRLNPTLAVAYCSLGDSLAYEGRYDEAMKEFHAALSVSPNDPQRWAFLTYGALAQLFRGDFHGALRWADEALEIPNCQYWALAHKTVALSHLDHPSETAAAARRLAAARPEFSVAFAREKLFYVKRPEQIELYLSGLTRAGIAPD